MGLQAFIQSGHLSSSASSHITRLNESLCILTATMNQTKFGIVLVFASALVTLVLPTCVACAQDRVAVALDSLPKIKKIDQAAISPDGAQVAYIIDGEPFVADMTSGTAPH
jgi:hypothetical protein